MTNQMPRPFVLYRREDETGVSGTGVVAAGVAWADGTCTVRWLGEWPTTQDHDRGVASVQHIHGHGGKTTIIWADELPTPPPVSRASSDIGPDSVHSNVPPTVHSHVHIPPAGAS